VFDLSHETKLALVMQMIGQHDAVVFALFASHFFHDSNPTIAFEFIHQKGKSAKPDHTLRNYVKVRL
jgi:hypothetical protein